MVHRLNVVHGGGGGSRRSRSRRGWQDLYALALLGRLGAQVDDPLPPLAIPDHLVARHQRDDATRSELHQHVISLIALTASPSCMHGRSVSAL